MEKQKTKNELRCQSCGRYFDRSDIIEADARRGIYLCPNCSFRIAELILQVTEFQS